MDDSLYKVHELNKSKWMNNDKHRMINLYEWTCAVAKQIEDNNHGNQPVP